MKASPEWLNILIYWKQAEKNPKKESLNRNILSTDI